MTEDAQALDARGCPIPLPVYQLVPCAKCLMRGLVTEKCECKGLQYIRLDPEAFPIARDHRAQETPKS